MTALAVSGGTVYAGGLFTSAGGSAGTEATRNRLAAFDASGNLTAWNPGANNRVTVLVVAGGTVYAGGWFTWAGGGSGTTKRNHLAAFDSSGNLTAWNPGVNESVNTLAVSDGMLYSGGYFTQAGGGAGTEATRNRLAAFDASSGALTPWNPGVNSTVWALAASGGTVYAGGDFTQIGGTANGASAQYLARLPVSDLPRAPANVKATRGDASGTVTWTAPSDTGGSAIINYVLEAAPGPNYDNWAPATTSGDCLTLTCTVTGLTNGARYQVRVRAANANGPGATSLASQWFQPQAPTANPALPTGLGATPGNTTLSVTWNPVADFGAGATTITQYMAYVFTGSTLLKICRVTGTPAATACQVTGLANGSSYTVKVRAWNNLGKFSDLSPSAGPFVPTAP